MSKTLPNVNLVEYDPNSFIKELVQPNVTVNDLQNARKAVQNLADETNTLLKKNVYKNYTLFIDTAKEISLLKNEMYTLSNLLNDEQKLLSSLLDISISGDRTHGLTAIEKKEVAAKFRKQGINSSNNLPKSESAFSFNPSLSKELQEILDKIEGVTRILDSRNRVLLMHGEFIELDSNDYKPIPNQGTIFAVLLNDCLILSTAFPSYSRFSNKKYKFQGFHELDNIAVINVKDPNLKNAFKILMSTQTKVYIVDNTNLKTKWLEAFEQAKKQRRASLTLQRRDSMLFPNHNISSSNLQNQAKTPMSPIDRPYSSILNSFEGNDLDDVAESDGEMIPEWLTKVPEDLDVFIAQRNFEEAVSLIYKINDHFQSYPKCCDNQIQRDLKLRMNNKMQDLINVISNELQITPDRSLQSGTKSARKAVGLLIKLGKSSTATRLFLTQRSALLKFCLKQQKIDGATLQYIKRMSSVFFNNVIETCKEFQRAFEISQNTNCVSSNLSSLNDSLIGNYQSSFSLVPALSALIVWVKKQLNHFLSLFSKQVFNSQVPPNIAAECFLIIRNQSAKLSKLIGLDLIFMVEFELRGGLEKIILEYKEKILEGVKIRCNEDQWKTQNHLNKAGINKFIEDLKDCNLECVANYVFDECRVNLTQNTTTFAKIYLNSIKDLLKLYTDFTKPIIMEAIIEVFEVQMKHYETSIKIENNSDNKKFIRKNVAFLIESVLELAKTVYQEIIDEYPIEIERLKQNYLYLKNESNVTVIEKGSKTKVMIDFL